MTSRALLLFAGIALLTLSWVAYQFWAFYDLLGSPLVALYFPLTVGALGAGGALVLYALLRRPAGG